MNCVFSAQLKLVAILSSLLLPALQALGEAPVFTTMIEAGSSWSYSDDGARPAGFGTEDLDFGDWPTGSGQLGYGDGDEATVLNSAAQTVYFARAFQVDHDYFVLRVDLVADDGAIVYLNGVEVVRDNMAPGEVTHGTLAETAVGGPGESEYTEFYVGSEGLRPGENVIAVEVHQVSFTSSDLSFDLRLVGGREPEEDPDSDGDGLLDEWEIAHFGNLDQTGEGDPDGDWLSNDREQASETDPIDNDSDDDDFGDGAEVAAGSDPNDLESVPHRMLEKLAADGGSAGDGFGEKVAISGNTLAVAAPESDGGAGAVCVFERRMVAGEGGGVTPAEAPDGASNLFGKIVISELMYEPAGEGGFEFIELLNTCPTGLDLSGLQFTDGVAYQFPAGSVIEPAGRLVLGEDVTVAHLYSGSLSNGGERLRLEDAAGDLVVELTYDDRAPWPEGPNGGGSSLVLRDPFSNPDANDPGNWAESSAAGGTPGFDDPDAESAEGPRGEARPRWVQVARLVGDGTTGFGSCVALEGRTLVVARDGGVSVFEGADWADVTELTTATAAPGASPAIAIHGNTILASAVTTEDPSPVILVFERARGSWDHIDSIGSPEPQEADEFGSSLALHRNTALAGSRQGVFVFRRVGPGGHWDVITKLEDGGGTGAQIGVALHGNTAVVAGNEPAGGDRATVIGRVYSRGAGDEDSWGQIAELEVPREVATGERACPVAVRGSTILIGSSRSAGGGDGRVYVFRHRRAGDSPWVFDRTLVPNLSGTGTSFGRSVDLSGNLIVAGAPSGCAYVLPVHEADQFEEFLAKFRTAAELADPEIASMMSDPDDDTLDNVMEFGLGLDPTTPIEDEDYLRSISTGITGDAGAECLTFTFSVPEAMPAGLIYEVQVSGQLDSGWESLSARGLDGVWAGDGEVIEHVAQDGRLCFTVHDTETMADAGRRFFRLVLMDSQ